MRELIEWMEARPTRARKVIAVFTALVWLMATIGSYGLYLVGYDTLALYSLVTAQFAAVVGFYMTTKAETDYGRDEVSNNSDGSSATNNDRTIH